MPRLNAKVALVTGGASGLGNAIAARLVAEGATVVITDLQRELGESVAREHGFTYLLQDVTDEAQWPGVIGEIEARFGRLDILVNNAGILGPMDAVNPENTRLTDWRKIFVVNADSVFLGCRAAIPAMNRAGGGSIINLSSVAGLRATPYGTAYGASKAVVRHLTKSVAQHCAQERLNIRCNSVHPGNVLTPLWLKQAEENARLRGCTPEQIIAEAESRIPLGDLTRPDDVAAAVAFLASDDSRHITGTKLIVDGGIMECDSFRPRTGT
jgi:3(or 17)beta-hydroxysteroid dehydrogenase